MTQTIATKLLHVRQQHPDRNYDWREEYRQIRYLAQAILGIVSDMPIAGPHREPLKCLADLIYKKANTLDLRKAEADAGQD